jgi:hypothetical protein
VKALGATALDVWRAWRSEGYLMGTSCFARSPAIGEVCFGPVFGEAVDKLHVVTNAHSIRRATNDEEDIVWDELLRGRLQIYRRRNAPLSGASMDPTQTLHAADGTPIRSGSDE